MSLDGPAVGAQPVGAAFDDPVDALDRTGPAVHGDELAQALDERLLATLQIGRQPSYAVSDQRLPTRARWYSQIDQSSVRGLRSSRLATSSRASTASSSFTGRPIAPATNRRMWTSGLTVSTPRR